MVKEITNILKIPTIGIGASVHCDGQVLVTDDILGLTEAYKEIFATNNLTDNLSKLNGEFKENPLVKNVIEFITKDKKRSICTPFSKE